MTDSTGSREPDWTRIADAIEKALPSAAGRGPIFHIVPESTSLDSVLRSEPSLAVFSNEQMRFDGLGGAGSTGFPMIVSWCVTHAMESSVQHVVEDLKAYLTASHLNATLIVGLVGVKLPDGASFDLADSVRISESSVTLAIENSPFRRQAFPYGYRRPATAELSLEFELPKIHTDGQTFPPPSFQKVVRDSAARVDTAALVLGLANRSAIVTNMRTAPFSPCVPGSIGHSWSSPTTVPLVGEKLISDFDVEKTRRLHQLLLGLPSKLRARLGIAMHRLQQALLDYGSPDGFIDLGIGFEAVFLGDQKDELAFRLKIRGARLLGKTPEERLRIGELFKQLYNARSKAVHTGRVPDSCKIAGAMVSSGELFQRGQTILADSIESMIQRGRDEWDGLELE